MPANILVAGMARSYTCVFIADLTQIIHKVQHPISLAGRG